MNIFFLQKSSHNSVPLTKCRLITGKTGDWQSSRYINIFYFLRSVSHTLEACLKESRRKYSDDISSELSDKEINGTKFSRDFVYKFKHSQISASSLAL